MANQGVLSVWIDSLPEDGRYAFSRDDAETVSGASDAAVKMIFRRLKKRGVIVSPRRGFYVVVPPEYRSAGSPPATWFIDDLMRHLGRRYYVALLSAAALHGAGHQQPMAFQVIADAVERDIEVGRVRIEFHVSNRIEGAATQDNADRDGHDGRVDPRDHCVRPRTLPIGLGILEQHRHRALGARRATRSRLSSSPASARVARSDVQRLGWLLDLLSEGELADALHAALRGQAAGADAAEHRARSQLTRHSTLRWRVLVNDDVEPDL